MTPVHIKILLYAQHNATTHITARSLLSTSEFVLLSDPHLALSLGWLGVGRLLVHSAVELRQISGLVVDSGVQRHRIRPQQPHTLVRGQPCIITNNNNSNTERIECYWPSRCDQISATENATETFTYNEQKEKGKRKKEKGTPKTQNPKPKI